MSKWTDETARKTATRAFCQHLHKSENKEDRQRCKADSGFAKKLFAKLGGFQIEEDLPPGGPVDDAIPTATTIRVFEVTEKWPRDKYVDILLPNPDKPLPDMPEPPAQLRIDISDIYRCTWIPWSS